MLSPQKYLSGTSLGRTMNKPRCPSRGLLLDEDHPAHSNYVYMSLPVKYKSYHNFLVMSEILASPFYWAHQVFRYLNSTGRPTFYLLRILLVGIESLTQWLLNFLTQIFSFSRITLYIFITSHPLPILFFFPLLEFFLLATTSLFFLLLEKKISFLIASCLFINVDMPKASSGDLVGFFLAFHFSTSGISYSYP